MALETIIYGLCEPRPNHPRFGQVRYVGKTKHKLADRLSGHLKERHSNRRTVWIARCMADGYVPAIVEIQRASADDWQKWECYWIEMFREAGYDLVNGTAGGDGLHDPTPEVRDKIGAVAAGRKLSEDWRAKISAGMKNHKHFGRRPSAETRAKMSLARMGHSFSQVSQQKMSKKAKNRSAETRLKIAIAHTGLRPSEATRQKMSESAKRRAPASPDTRRKISAYWKGRKRKKPGWAKD